jgi:elongation factor G
MDEIVSFFPEPTAHGPVPTADGGEVRVDAEGAVSGLVFKTIFDPYVGRLNFVKVLSGELKPGSELINARTGKKERVAHVLKMVGKETSDIASAPAGDVVVLPKLGDVITGDTLSEKGDVVIAPLPLPEPLYPVAVVAKTKADEDKLGTAINKLVEEEPTLRLRRDDETHQTVLSTLGETAVAVALAKLKDRYNAEAELVDLRIPYRETIRKSATAQGRHKKQTGGSGQFADCWLRVDPNHGQGYEFKDEIVGGKISKPYIVAIDKGVQNAMTEGVLAGYPMVDVKVAVFDGSMHAVDSNEMAFRTAARIGFRAATEKADMVLLEPVATLLIDAPEDYSGAIMGDMSSRRGRILGMEMVDGMQRIKAVVPYAEVVHYSPILRSVTHGTGMYSLEIGEYAEVPHDMAQKVIDEYLKHKAEGH